MQIIMIIAFNLLSSYTCSVIFFALKQVYRDRTVEQIPIICLGAVHQCHKQVEIFNMSSFSQKQRSIQLLMNKDEFELVSPIMQHALIKVFI